MDLIVYDSKIFQMIFYNFDKFGPLHIFLSITKFNIPLKVPHLLVLGHKCDKNSAHTAGWVVGLGLHKVVVISSDFLMKTSLAPNNFTVKHCISYKKSMGLPKSINLNFDGVSKHNRLHIFW